MWPRMRKILVSECFWEGRLQPQKQRNIFRWKEVMKTLWNVICCGFLTFNQTLQACIKCQTMCVCLCECICLHLGKACSENISMTTAVGRQCLEPAGPWPASLGETPQDDPGPDAQVQAQLCSDAQLPGSQWNRDKKLNTSAALGLN